MASSKLAISFKPIGKMFFKDLHSFLTENSPRYNQKIIDVETYFAKKYEQLAEKLKECADSKNLDDSLTVDRLYVEAENIQDDIVSMRKYANLDTAWNHYDGFCGYTIPRNDRFKNRFLKRSFRKASKALHIVANCHNKKAAMHQAAKIRALTGSRQWMNFADTLFELSTVTVYIKCNAYLVGDKLEYYFRAFRFKQDLIDNDDNLFSIVYTPTSDDGIKKIMCDKFSELSRIFGYVVGKMKCLLSTAPVLFNKSSDEQAKCANETLALADVNRQLASSLCLDIETLIKSPSKIALLSQSL